MRTENETAARERETNHSKPDLRHAEYKTIRVQHSVEMLDTAQLISNTKSSNQDHRRPVGILQGSSKLEITDPNLTTVQLKLNVVAGRDGRLFEIRNDPSTDPVTRAQNHPCCRHCHLMGAG
jgi:hypothetical protein